MPKPPMWADDGTDPDIRGPRHAPSRGAGAVPDDEIEEISPEELGMHRGRQQVHLTPGVGVAGADEAPPPQSPALAEKTRVASIDDIAPPPPAEATVITQAPQPVEAEATVITSNPLANRPQRQLARGKLVVIEGKESGKVFELTDGTRVLGRSRDVDLCLLDIQVSRKHAELVADHNGVLLRDLGSGNGTLVNGQPVTETRLVHGDEIALGDHVLRFEEEGPVASALAPAAGRSALPTARGGAPAAAMPAAPVPSVVAARRARRTQGAVDPKRKKLLVALGSVAGIVLLGVVIKLATHKPAPVQPQGPSPAVVAHQAFQEGLDLFRKERYAEALARFQASLDAQPNDDQSKEYLEASKRELATASALDEATRLLAENDFSGARSAYQRVDEKSLRYSEAQRGLERVNEAEAAATVAEAQKQLEDDNLENARAAFEKALKIVPGYPAAQSGLEQVDARSRELAQQSAADRRRDAERRRQERLRAQRNAKQRVQAALGTGEDLFDKGQFQKAVGAFEDLSRNSGNPRVRSGAAAKAKALKAFIPAYERGMREADARSADAAVKDLSVAAAKARVISRGGRVHSEISRKLGAMYFLQGRMAFNAGRHAEAYRAWTQALEYDSSNKYARDGMKDLEKLGKTLYLEAYTQKGLNRSAAIQKWKKVVAMTSPSFEYNQKAKERLAEMGGE